MERYYSEQRTKKAPINLARVGAVADKHGVRHVGEKGTKAFLRKRKQDIVQLNRKQYHSTDDKVEMEPDEY